MLFLGQETILIHIALTQKSMLNRGTGDDTINFTGNGGHSVILKEFERYDVSFWDGSLYLVVKKFYKTYAPGDKVVVTDNLALSSGGTGQDVIISHRPHFSNGRQNLKWLSKCQMEKGVLTLYLMPMTAIVMKWDVALPIICRVRLLVL